MVYGGKPSTGCYLCRKRKIKCDEAHPECRNCIIYGRPCPGYRPDAVFRNETKKVERLVKSSANVNVHSNTSTQGSSSASDSSRSAVPHRQHASSHGKHHGNATLTLYSPADSSWDQRALCYFFDQYTIKADAEEGGHLDYLPPLYAREVGHQSESSSSCLRWAVEATALMTFANAKNALPLMIKARRGYGQALRGLQEALASPANAVKDETFASVVLLSLYEDISGERNGLLSSHTAGFEFLTKLRGKTLVGHRHGRDMLTFAYTHTYVEILALGEKPRFDNEWVHGMLDLNIPAERIILTASKLCHLFARIRSSPKPPDQAAVESWIESGREYDIELSQWTQTLPERWLPLVVYSAQGEPLLTYNRVQISVVWNYYRAVRVVIQQLLLGLNSTLTSVKAANKQFSNPSDTSSSEPESESVLDEPALRAIIREMTTDVCRSIPFALADVDSLGRPTKSDSAWQMRAAQGFGLLWPLWYILSSGMPTPSQVELIRTVLSRVGSTLGIKLALVLAREAERIRGEQDNTQGEILGQNLPRGACNLGNQT